MLQEIRRYPARLLKICFSTDDKVGNLASEGIVHGLHRFRICWTGGGLCSGLLLFDFETDWLIRYHHDRY